MDADGTIEPARSTDDTHSRESTKAVRRRNVVLFNVQRAPSHSQQPYSSSLLRPVVLAVLYTELAAVLYYTCIGDGLAGFSTLLQLAGAYTICNAVAAVHSGTQFSTPSLAIYSYSPWKLLDIGRAVLVDLPLAHSVIPPGGVNTTFIRLLADPEHRAAVVASELSSCAS